MPRAPGIGKVEAEILRYIIDHDPITVREVADFLAEKKGHTRTTALNTMERLRQKGYLKRSQVEGAYRYSPSQPRAQLLRGLVRDFVDEMLGGSIEPFVSYLTQQSELTPEQLHELRDLVDRLEKQPPADREQQGGNRR